MSILKRWFSKPVEGEAALSERILNAAEPGNPEFPEDQHAAATEQPPHARAMPSGPIPPGQKIGFDAQLIDSLKHDHVALFSMFSRIGQMHAHGDYAHTAAELQRFTSALQTHVLKENVRFYAYMQSHLPRESDEAMLLHEFRREMNVIIRTVSEFLKKYEGMEQLNEHTHEQFEHDLEQVGNLLLQRISREESSLYPLYH